MRIAHIVMTGALGLACLGARADGQAELKLALERLRAQTPLKAVLETKAWRRNGEGKDAEETQGQASIVVEDGGRGMQLSYDREILARMEAEARAQAKNPNAQTPTLMAAREFGPNDLRPMISAAGELARMMEKAVWKSEKLDSFNGKPVRLISYATSISSLSDRDRKYVKDFEGSLDIWIGADGTPLASRLNQHYKGRAFVVVSFEGRNEEQQVYSLIGDRLVTLRKESKGKSSGAGEHDENRIVKTLQLQS